MSSSMMPTQLKKAAAPIAASLIAACLAAAAVSPVLAQGYPTRPITVVVPFPAGGPSDVVARIVAENMSKTLGQQMVIENVGGAGGTIGSAPRRGGGARRLYVARRQHGLARRPRRC